jgi:hypothetical protein
MIDSNVIVIRLISSRIARTSGAHRLDENLANVVVHDLAGRFEIDRAGAATTNDGSNNERIEVRDHEEQNRSPAFGKRRVHNSLQHKSKNKMRMCERGRVMSGVLAGAIVQNVLRNVP